MASTASNDRCPFQRIDDVSCLTESEALNQFMTHGFLWAKGTASTTTNANGNDNISSTNNNPLDNFFSTHSEACQAHWSLENQGDLVGNETDVSPATIPMLDKKKSFYASTIIPKTQETALADLLKLVPPFPVLPDLHMTGGAWIFCGHVLNKNHNVVVAANNSKKRKRPTTVLLGRAEHVDQVPHSGTWHYQLCGNKTWLLRPHKDLFESHGKECPDLVKAGHAAERNDAGSWRLRICVQQGDWFVLDTRIWYHCTQLDGDNNNNHAWSVSVARDFYLPVPCPLDTEVGQVILQEEDIPDDMPRSSTHCNCALAQLECDDKEKDKDKDKDDTDEETTIVLIATRHVEQGELLFLPDDDDDVDSNQEYNADETVDPRAMALQDYSDGSIVLETDDIPYDLPRSLDPNCELAERVKNGDIVLKAIRDIVANEVLCILPDDDVEYEEVEVDLATGELKRPE